MRQLFQEHFIYLVFSQLDFDVYPSFVMMIQFDENPLVSISLFGFQEIELLQTPLFCCSIFRANTIFTIVLCPTLFLQVDNGKINN